MPKNPEIRKVMVIGSGPIVIGQAAEFDYSGTQACRSLKEEGIEVCLVNSNPATIMTDKDIADEVYIEPLNIKTLEKIIEKEKPDSILPTLGGQAGLNLGIELAESGFLDAHNVRLLGTSALTIKKAEDRLAFKETMEKIGEPCAPSTVVENVDDGAVFAARIGYPVVLRPAYTLGGTGGGIAHDETELRDILETGLRLSRVGQVLVERYIGGWKEIEYEVMRDASGNCITVCSMENVDPVGIHTGDSIVVAPAQTLSDKEYQMLRSAAINIINELQITGGCNIQFALHPTSFEYYVIEVNPRVSRSSALASKATGYPIAKVTSKIAIGYRLDEIKNAVTGKTFASFEPAIDYIALKFPKWPFDKFVYAKRELGTQMKATGEVMSIADTFEAALMKAVRGVEISLDTLSMPKLAKMGTEELLALCKAGTDERLFAIYELLKRGITADEIHLMTMMDVWFLAKLKNLIEFERSIENKPLTAEKYIDGKRLGYTDAALERISGSRRPLTLTPSYRMVDTCAAEYEAVTPYFYSVYNAPGDGGEDEASEFIKRGSKQKVMVLGSGPIRIGQGIEFDYASVHCVWSLKELGYEVIIVNNNPETVSTDFDTSDRLYFEPLSPEDVMNIINLEKPIGVVVAFGGQTAIKLTKTLARNNVRILGSSADTIDMAEDRKRFDELLAKLDIKRAAGTTVMTLEEALEAARELTYPVLIRPSYVLGGQNMIIAYSDRDVEEYMEIILRQKIDNPVLIDKYLSGIEIEVDAICDGRDILIPGIMEHIERTGIHSGDSIAVYPAQHISDEIADTVTDVTEKLCRGLNAIGLVNLQYIIKDGELFVIEVNPRASRTVPYISKVTGVPMCDLAVRVSLGEKLEDLGYGTGVYKISPYVCCKVPVFSFEKLTNVDTALGPEMKSTGEVLGIGKSLQEALFKGLVASGCKMKKSGGVFISVRDQDKREIPEIAEKFYNLGFRLYATSGTADLLKRKGMEVDVVGKIHECEDTPGYETAISLLDNGSISYVISTSTKGRDPARDSVKIRRKATQLEIPCLTAIDTANAIADSLMSRFSDTNTEIVNLNTMRSEKRRLKFVKMQGCGNDYIYFNCMKEEIEYAESLSVMLSDRHTGIGGDGVVLIMKSDVADARMRMFNSDGSEGMMCGNAIRCVAKYLYDNYIVHKLSMRIETKSGVKNLKLYTTHGQVSRVTVDMGRVELSPPLIPVDLTGDSVVDRAVIIGGKTYNITCVSVGNPHCVVFGEGFDKMDLAQIGPLFENDKIFPDRVNTEFVEVLDDHTIKMRVWERGTGETMACGTGACAAAVAACLNKHCVKGEDIHVILRGGELVINYSGDTVWMTGPCVKVYDGEVEI
ncbi:MAG: carbamoyl-phosphate synthase large subunit [Clostridiales bacterium]|nr:carbamoyl-phosphate synthase large subunit [Clostridiales bacterium]